MLVFVWVGESLNSLVVFVSDEVARYLLSDIGVDPVRSEDIVGGKLYSGVIFLDPLIVFI